MTPDAFHARSTGPVTDFLSVGARARGLSARLLGRARLEALAGSTDFPSLLAALSRSARGFVSLPDGARVAELDAAVRHQAAGELLTLERWCSDPSTLDVFFADQDRRSLRALLRGALEGAPAEARLGGLVPTPTLPEGALVALAKEPTPRQLVAHLVLLAHPDAARLMSRVTAEHPPVFEIEVALAEGFVDRASAVARRDPNLREFVIERIDLVNLAAAALLCTSGDGAPDAAASFLEGGRFVTKELFSRAAGAGSPQALGAMLSRALKGTPLETLELGALQDPARLEEAGLLLAIEHQRRRFRLDPVGSAALVLYMLGLEAQGRDLRRIGWGVALGAPADLLRRSLVTPWP